jgi:hypothetical protein
MLPLLNLSSFDCPHRYHLILVFQIMLPVRTGLKVLAHWRTLPIQPSVRHIISGRSRSEAPQAVVDGQCSDAIDIDQSHIVLDWGTVKPSNDKKVSTPIEHDEKRVGVPDTVRGKEMEILWPTEKEMQEGEMQKPQWERKQINVRRSIIDVRTDCSLAILAHLVRVRFQR